jgi:hypothetical protein
VQLLALGPGVSRSRTPGAPNAIWSHRLRHRQVGKELLLYSEPCVNSVKTRYNGPYGAGIVTKDSR